MFSHIASRPSLPLSRALSTLDEFINGVLSGFFGRMATHFQRAGEQAKIGLVWILWTSEFRELGRKTIFTLGS